MTALESADAVHLSLAGRKAELARLREVLDRTAAGMGGAAFIEAPLGKGKSRLLQAMVEEARERGFLAGCGNAYPLESGIPYAIFRDLLDPLVHDLSEDRRTLLTRGGPEFELLIPRPGGSGSGDDPVDSIPDLRARLLWNFPDFLNRLRANAPLLLVFEDLEWADPSSLELLHFLVRQARRYPIAILASWSGGTEGTARAIGEAIQPLARKGEVLRLELGPLDGEGVTEAISGTFAVDTEVVRSFGTKLHRWTGGSPLYVAATLESLIASGHLREEGGRWAGWEVRDLPAPGSIRELVLERLAALPAEAREAAEVVAVAGMQAPVALLAAAMDGEPAQVERALRELVRGGVLVELSREEDVAVEFRHPILREALLGEIGKARTRRLHSALLGAFETLYGEGALDRAAEVAPHVIGAGGEFDAARGSRYLRQAGKAALMARADREALTLLEGALALLDRAAERVDPNERRLLIEDLARACQRLGDFDRAQTLLEATRASLSEDDPTGAIAGLDRRLALLAFWAGRPEEGLHHAERGILAARERGDAGLEARIRLVAGSCLRDLGDRDGALREAGEALRLSEAAGDDRLRLSSHRTLLLIHTWSGPVDLAHRHGNATLALAEATGDPSEAMQAHWAMAVMAGLTGNLEELHHHLKRAKVLADEIGSPLLRLQVADVQIELATSLGEWSRGIDLAAEAIRMARALNQRLLLPRLLVWSGFLRIGTGELKSARRDMEEAWALVEAHAGGGPGAPHLRILVHAGMAALALAEGDHAEAIRIGRKGIEVVDATGYRAWAIHRLLPTIVEAALHVRDLDTARWGARRLREEAEWFGHPVGLIWADASDGLIAWISGDIEEGARRMAGAAERLEKVQVIPDAARLRRQLAGRLVELGDRDAAIRELRRVHDTLATLGAVPELDKARGQFREVGARPPVRTAHPGEGSLTPREVEVARLIAQRYSNKAIGKHLDISPRTVGTHLTSIFRKMGIRTRGELVDLVRDGRIE